MAGTDGPRPLRFIVIGAGMAGILAAIKLREAGCTDVVVYEKGDRLGGTWRENTYPGIGCDVPSLLYSYSFAPNPGWSHHYSPGDEILAYFERVARDFGVDGCIRLGQEIVRCDYVDGRWHLETATGHRDAADVVIAATGVLHHPKYPDIDGLDSFAGTVFHSARWDHDVVLDGARVGVVGTGSTAVQIITAIVEQVARLSVFQRTPQWIMPRLNPEYSDRERAEFRAEPERLSRAREELRGLFDGFADSIVDVRSPHMTMIADACRANLEEHVADPVLRERLRPDYQAACKRLVMGERFYDAIQHIHTELVTEGIACVEPDGVRTKDGALHELDVLVLATGFQVDAFMRPMAITGRGGVTLAELWAQRPTAYLSVSIPDFPNFFMLNGPNGPVGNFSLIEVAELQIAYIRQLVDLLRDGTAREISTTTEAMRAHEEQRTDAARHTIWATGCRSWYLDDRGVPAVWPWTFSKFRDLMAAPDLDDYDVVR
jgi:cation diffusion facilitator CzcD-associated flavoprotein CzcO